MSIAIDFGCTNTCVAVSKNGRATVVKNTLGVRQTPSWVAFTKNGTIVGSSAKNNLHEDAKNTIYDLKRLFDQRLRDLDGLQTKWPFQLVEDSEQLLIRITVGEETRMAPEDIIVKLLSEMKKIASEFLDDEITTVVFTVPPYFTAGQRRLLKEAATSAGLYGDGGMVDALAAAYHFGFQKRKGTEQYILVFHLGGRTVCVTVLAFNEHGYLEVKKDCFSYDLCLGGENFTERLVSHCADKFQREHNIDVQRHAAAMICLRDKCEKAKHRLSRDAHTRIHIQNLAKQKNLETGITRIEFGKMTVHLRQKIDTLIQSTLEKAEITHDKIAKVVLVGGATHMPMIPEMLIKIFDKAITKSNNPEETVAIGAVIRHGNECDEPGSNSDGSVSSDDEEEEAKGIGIDLGTTFSSIAISENEMVTVIPDAQGKRETPSCVYYDGKTTKHWVGESAENRAEGNPGNYIYDTKRMIGLPFGDPAVQADKKKLSYEVVEENERPYIKIEMEGKPMKISPEKVSSAVLSHLKKIAEEYLEKTVTSAVIAVPASFSTPQRQATIQAAKMADIKVLKVIHEPTAAAYALRQQKTVKLAKNIMVFDLGGGTFDVTIFRVEKNGSAIRVMTTCGDSHLGGQDFTNGLLDGVIGKQKQRWAEIERNQRRQWDVNSKQIQKMKFTENDIRSLRRDCERKKKVLSGETSVSIKVVGENMRIMRHFFEHLNASKFQQLLDAVDKAIQQAKLQKQDIEKVLLVGGGSRMPKIYEMMTGYFGKRKVMKSTNPEEDVVSGAALQSERLGSGENIDVDDGVNDVTHLSLGVRDPRGMMQFVIPRGTGIPCEKIHMHPTESDRKSVKIVVYEGERRFLSDNTLWGKVEFECGRKKKAVKVIFRVDKNGTLDVLPMRKSRQGFKVTLNLSSGEKTLEEIDEMIKHAGTMKSQDEALVNRMQCLDALEKLARMHARRTFPWIKTHIQRSSEETLIWIKNHPDASIDDIKREESALKKLL